MFHWQCVLCSSYLLQISLLLHYLRRSTFLTLEICRKWKDNSWDSWDGGNLLLDVSDRISKFLSSYHSTIATLDRFRAMSLRRLRDPHHAEL
jgi:hypothetical protein